MGALPHASLLQPQAESRRDAPLGRRRPPDDDATFNSRGAALIAVAWDSGARAGEIRNLSVGDVIDYKHGLQIIVDGKTGQRSVTLIPSVPFPPPLDAGSSAERPGRRAAVV